MGWFVRNRIADVDLDTCRIRITQAKAATTASSLSRRVQGNLALHIEAQRRTGAAFLFESSWKKPYSDRGVRKILARYTRPRASPPRSARTPVRQFLFTWLKTQGIDDALIQP